MTTSMNKKIKRTAKLKPGMRKAHRLGQGLFALMLLSSAPAWAATQCINMNNPSPLEVCVGDDTTPGVWVQQPDGRKNQYYNSYSWGSTVWLNDAGYTTLYLSHYGSNTAVTPVSNTLSGSGTEADPWIITTIINLGTSGIQMTQEFSYINGERKLKKSWSLRNQSSAAIPNVRLYHGGDTTFGGLDSSYTGYDANKKMVHVSNPDFTNTGYMGFYGTSATPANRYYAGYYYDGNTLAGNGTDLPNTFDSNLVDAGYFLQWNRASLGAGETWTVTAFEEWSEAGVEPPPPVPEVATPVPTMSSWGLIMLTALMTLLGARRVGRRS